MKQGKCNWREREMAEGGGLDQFLADLGTTDAKKKLTTGQVQPSTFHNWFRLFLVLESTFAFIRTSSTTLATLLRV